MHTDQRYTHAIFGFRVRTHRWSQKQRAAVARQRQQALPLRQQRQARQLLPRRGRRRRPRITAAQTCAGRKAQA